MDRGYARDELSARLARRDGPTDPADTTSVLAHIGKHLALATRLTDTGLQSMSLVRASGRPGDRGDRAEALTQPSLLPGGVISYTWLMCSDSPTRRRP